MCHRADQRIYSHPRSHPGHSAPEPFLGNSPTPNWAARNPSMVNEIHPSIHPFMVSWVPVALLFTTNDKHPDGAVCCVPGAACPLLVDLQAVQRRSQVQCSTHMQLQPHSWHIPSMCVTLILITCSRASSLVLATVYTCKQATNWLTTPSQTPNLHSCIQHRDTWAHGWPPPQSSITASGADASAAPTTILIDTTCTTILIDTTTLASPSYATTTGASTTTTTTTTATTTTTTTSITILCHHHHHHDHHHHHRHRHHKTTATWASHPPTYLLTPPLTNSHVLCALHLHSSGGAYVCLSCSSCQKLLHVGLGCQ